MALFRLQNQGLLGCHNEEYRAENWAAGLKKEYIWAHRLSGRYPSKYAYSE